MKHPRVVVLPGERGQEMYTATALQRAAAIAVASAAIMTQEETAATQRNKKILEAAGPFVLHECLIHVRVNCSCRRINL